MAKRLVANTFGDLASIPTLQEVLPNEFKVAEEVKNEGVLESVMVKDGAQGAYLVFTETDAEKVKEYINRLPLHKYFERVEYTLVEKAF